MNTLATLSGRMDGMTELAAHRQECGPPTRPFGRVDQDGTVYVRTAERRAHVGQVPDVPAEEALAFFTRRYEALELEVSLLQSRISTRCALPRRRAGIGPHGTGSGGRRPCRRRPGWAAPPAGRACCRSSGRNGRRAGPSGTGSRRRPARRRSSSCSRRSGSPPGNDWRGGVNRFRALLDQWKALPRLDRATDDELWHRFSSARTAYTRRRKAQFAAQSEAREAARVTKEQLAAEAEALASSTDWGPTTGAYRDLMARWKAAGPAPRGVDEALWKRFRAPRTPSSPPSRRR